MWWTVIDFNQLWFIVGPILRSQVSNWRKLLNLNFAYTDEAGDAVVPWYCRPYPLKTIWADEKKLFLRVDYRAYSIALKLQLDTKDSLLIRSVSQLEFMSTI